MYLLPVCILILARLELGVFGVLLLFYNRLVGDEQDRSKLKLRTALYEVKEVNCAKTDFEPKTVF